MLLNVTNNTIYSSYFFCDKYHDNNKLVREPVYFIMSVLFHHREKPWKELKASVWRQEMM